MLVRFKFNLGSSDAVAHQLDFAQCTAGAELNVDDEAGQWLVDRGIAEAVVVKAVPKAVPIQGIPIESKKQKANDAKD